MGGIGGGLTLHATVGNVSLDPYGEVIQQSLAIPVSIRWPAA
ncbi:MAG: hypothetical protein WAL37_06395 [Xanthobacteraceae bacterium]